jgi:hypothetical protein
VSVTDPQVCRALAVSLMKHAVIIRDAPAGSEGAFWSALRSFARLAPPSDAAAYLAFLRPRDVATTKQCTLQCIEMMFADGYRGGADLVGLRRRVRELARRYLDPEWTITEINEALSLCTFSAAAALGDPALEDLTQRLISCESPRLVDLALDKLVTLQAACLTRVRRRVRTKPRQANLMA